MAHRTIDRVVYLGSRWHIKQLPAHLLSNHYNLTRTMYTRMLDEGSLGGT